MDKSSWAFFSVILVLSHLTVFALGRALFYKSWDIKFKEIVAAYQRLDTESAAIIQDLLKAIKQSNGTY